MAVALADILDPDYALIPWRGIVKNITLKPTRTPYFLKPSLTTFYFSPLAVLTRYFICVAVTNRDWPTFFSAVPAYRLAPSFPVYLLRGGIEAVHICLERQVKSN